MFSDTSKEQAEDVSAKESDRAGIQQIPLLPFAIQLQNIFPVEIVARRFPVEMEVDINSIVLPDVKTELNLSEPGINPAGLIAQIFLEVKVSFPQEPRFFEIYFKLIGIFSYQEQYATENVQYFLQQGSLSVMLPSAREMLLSLCNRLQVPPIVLPLIQLASSSPPLP